MKIKIKQHDRHPEISIGVVIGAALLAWFAWALWRADEAVYVARRPLSRIAVVYQCDDGKRFEGFLNTKSQPCPGEDRTRRAWPVWTFQCTKDGAFVVQLRYTLDKSGHPRIRAARPLGFEWQEVDDDIGCPLCERALLPDLSFRMQVQRNPSMPGA